MNRITMKSILFVSQYKSVRKCWHVPNESHMDSKHTWQWPKLINNFLFESREFYLLEKSFHFKKIAEEQIFCKSNGKSKRREIREKNLWNPSRFSFWLAAKMWRIKTTNATLNQNESFYFLLTHSSFVHCFYVCKQNIAFNGKIHWFEEYRSAKSACYNFSVSNGHTHTCQNNVWFIE